MFFSLSVFVIGAVVLAALTLLGFAVYKGRR